MIAAEVYLLIGFMLLSLYLTLLMYRGQYQETAVRQSRTVLTAGYAEGTVYDRQMQPLVNRSTAYYAAASPSPETVQAILPHAEEMQPLLDGIRTGRPFICRVDTPDIACDAVTVVRVPERGRGHLTGQHILGYTLEHTGVTGLENDYDKLLRGQEDPVTVAYTVDARGRALEGIPAEVREVQHTNSGIVTALDYEVQALCEAQPIEKGAVVIMDVKTGDILGMASYPPYDPDRLGEAISDENAPLIDRCLCPYSVGSIFKLVTCAAAYRSHRTSFCTECIGRTAVRGQTFRCHDWRGHGEVDMTQAMIASCNVYFVELSEHLRPDIMRGTAQDLGFGSQLALSKSIVSQSGTLPSPEDLKLPAEMANFCFGQGKLTATPLQVTQMTCGIAGGGRMPIARLVLGTVREGEHPPDPEPPRYACVLSADCARFLQELMIAAVNRNEHSNAAPSNTFAAAKTSTAQTGRFDADGNELCHAWITGYFPLDKPRYAVTVLIEDGGYGNDAAAPIFRTIAETLTARDIRQNQQ
jgi:penicillin-binding protein 2